MAQEKKGKGRENKTGELFLRLCSSTLLRTAFDRVKKNNGKPGPDGQTVADFETDLETNLTRLQHELITETYQPGPVRRAYILKPSGKLRPIGIPNIRDRVVQTALLMLLNPLIDPTFLPCSYGFRPRRNTHQAIEHVRSLLLKRHHWVVDLDLVSYFDEIPHDLLMHRVEDTIPDAKGCRLIRQFLNVDIIESSKRYRPTKGTPQGAVISPLLANLFLHPLDFLLTNESYSLVRYADDLVVLSHFRKEAESAQALIESWASSAGIHTQPAKHCFADTPYNARHTPIQFLGHEFRIKKSEVFLAPSPNNVLKLKTRVRLATNGLVGPAALPAIIAEVKTCITSWLPYFARCHEHALSRLDKWMRTHIRCKIRSGGGSLHGRDVSNEALAQAGLVNLADAAIKLRSKHNFNPVGGFDGYDDHESPLESGLCPESLQTSPRGQETL
ncbi:group II intron reverse transcriptase/maturase [bacterium]|nr:group II intron reverse transcriptase/maturase [candidate division CSSED10-310 bacterium]